MTFPLAFYRVRSDSKLDPSPRGSRRRFLRPKSAPRAAKSAPRAAKRGPRAAKTAPRAPQEPPREPQEPPRRFQEAPRATKTPSRGLREPFWLDFKASRDHFRCFFGELSGAVSAACWRTSAPLSSLFFLFVLICWCWNLGAFGLHLLPRLCSDRAGKPGEKPQARTRSGSRHSRLRSGPSSKRRGGGAQRRREAPGECPGSLSRCS